MTVSSGLDPEVWGTLPTLFMGAAFTLGLVLVLIAGSHLATGNMLLVPLGALQGRIEVGTVVKNLTLVLIATCWAPCSWPISSLSRPESSAAAGARPAPPPR